MPRASFSHNPLLKVSRPVSACSRCRAAKVKCDGKLPACTACEKAGRESECSAANDQFARGKERSYVAALELRIEKLERRLQYAKTRKASLGFQEPDLSTLAQIDDRRDSMANIRAAIHRKAARNRETSDVDSIVSDFGFLSVNANTRDFEPSLNNMTFARLVLTATANNSLPESTHIELAPRHLAHGIQQFYMENIYSLLPCFPETQLITVFNDVYQQTNRIVKDSDYWLFYMVLAIGSLAQCRALNDNHYTTGVMFASKALNFADRALAPGHTTQIVSLLLLTQYSMLDPCHFDSWHLIGFTARAVVDLGFHQDPPLTASSDKSNLDLRRKIFYCVYGLDRAISMVHARTFSFTDDAINVAFPNPSLKRPNHNNNNIPHPLTSPHQSDPALLLFQLRRAQSFWYQELYQSHSAGPLQNPTEYVWQMCYEMREWGTSLPSHLPPATRQMFDQELRYSYVYCIAPSSRVPQICDYHRVLIFEYALTYLDVMYEIVAKGGINGALYTYHDALKIYFMASQLNQVLWDAQDMLLLYGGAAQVAVPMARPGGPPPPPIPRNNPGAAVGGGCVDNLRRSIDCLERVGQTLERFSERWTESTFLQRSFGELSKETMDRLRLKRDASSMDSQQQQMHFQNGGSMMTGQQVNQQQQQQQQAQSNQQSRQVRWVDVDVAQMIQGQIPPPS